ncbi:MAG: type VI secretion system protein ImpJ [Planctomycetota bacterium]|jgi:type VI secretion system protein ImpJ
MDGPQQLSVLWREGMFLTPQHMQAFSREVQLAIGRNGAIGRLGNYGFKALEVDEEALERDVFTVISAEAVFRDGSHVLIPENGQVESREFGEQFVDAELPVWLGVPSARSRVPQIEGAANGNSSSAATRFVVSTTTIFDENMGDSGREVEFRRFRARLFFGDEDRSGFECLRIANLVRRGKPVATSALSTTYIPPTLACGASAVLSSRLKAIATDVRSQARDLASRLPQTAALASGQKGADLGGFIKLQSVNASLATLQQVAGLPDLHPFDAYRDLIQTVGNLSVFGEERVMPDLPTYEHGKLDECFQAVFQAISELVVADVSVPYDTVEFTRDVEREGFYQVEVPPEWVATQPAVWLAIELARPTAEVAEMAPTYVRLVPTGDIERVLQGVVPGIELQYERRTPLSFPKKDALHYFKIETEGTHRASWVKIMEERSAVILSTLGTLGEVNFHLYVELGR